MFERRRPPLRDRKNTPTISIAVSIFALFAVVLTASNASAIATDPVSRRLRLPGIGRTTTLRISLPGEPSDWESLTVGVDGDPLEVNYDYDNVGRCRHDVNVYSDQLDDAFAIVVEVTQLRRCSSKYVTIGLASFDVAPPTTAAPVTYPPVTYPPATVPRITYPPVTLASPLPLPTIPPVLLPPTVPLGCYSSSVSTPTPFLGNYGEIFKLLDGTIWQVGLSYNYLYAYYPSIIVCPSPGKAFVNGKSISITRITPVVSAPTLGGLIESSISGSFEGWKGSTIVKLLNGQVWQQAEYTYRYTYRYGPRVSIYQAGIGYRMIVEGLTGDVAVRRLA